MANMRRNMRYSNVSGVSADRDEEPPTWTSLISQVFCLLVILTIVIWIIVDWKRVVYIFESFTAWIEDNPNTAIAAILAIYILSIIFMLPIAHFHYVFGFTYAKIYKSSLIGWSVAAPIVFLGVILGASASFLISRYFFRSYVKRKIIRNSERYPWLENF